MASLVSRINDLATAIGQDIKALSQSISASGGITVTSNTVNVPFSSEFFCTATLLDANAIVGKRVIVSIGQADDTAENEIEDIEGITVSAAIINNGEITFSFSFFGAIGGPIPVNYIIG